MLKKLKKNLMPFHHYYILSSLLYYMGVVRVWLPCEQWILLRRATPDEKASVRFFDQAAAQKCGRIN